MGFNQHFMGVTDPLGKHKSDVRPTSNQHLIMNYHPLYVNNHPIFFKIKVY